MNCKKLLNNYLLQNFCLKSLIFLAVLLFFFPQNSFALQDCSSLPSNTAANPGVNCDYFGLPRCNTVSSPNPRVNCADIIHLPLNTDLADQGVTVELGKNAVTECKNITLPATPVHNGNCIRFCDAPEAGITPNPGVNCVDRKCYQVVFGTTPVASGSGKNCEITSCKYLTAYELNDPKFDDSSKKYCDGQLKCYQFEQDKLQFLKVRQTNTMCLLHSCKPSAPECGADDTLNISNKGAAYETEYENRILAGYTLESNTICSPVTCLPVVNRSYFCSATYQYSNKTQVECTALNGVFASPKCTINLLNQKCDGYNASGTPESQNCNGSYCTKKVNCNQTPNEPECASSSDVGTDVDSDAVDSWFYRPMPLEKATAKTGSKIAYYDLDGNPRYYLPMYFRSDKTGYDRLCYDKNQLEFNGMLQTDTNDGYYLPSGCTVNGDDNNCDSANGCSSGYCCRGGNYCVQDAKKTWSWWGNRVGTYWHYFNTHQSRSPGICDLDSSGFDWGNRGSGYLYLCGNKGSLYSVPSNPVSSNLLDYTGYFKGYVSADFESTTPEYKVTVCLRYKNTLLIDEANGSQACGLRECGIGCEFGSCYKKGCGRDLCHEYTIKDSAPTKCQLNEDLMKNNRNGEAGYECLEKFDQNVRVRVVEEKNSICAFLDSGGILAYDYKYNNTFDANKDANGNYEACTNGSYLVDMQDAQGNLVYDSEGNIKKGCKFEFYYTFLGGNEKYDDGECISGTKNEAGICVDGNSSYGWNAQDDIWRAHKFKQYSTIDSVGNYKFKTAADGSYVGIDLSPVIPYISHDYYDIDGKAFFKQQCPRIPLRVDGGRLYNLANNSNSPKLFIPPLTIANARVKKGGAIILPTGNDKYGKTDFFSPEIEIKFGTQSKLLSLNPLADESVPIKLSATVASLNYSIDVFVRKKYDSSAQKPTFCLYRVVKDINDTTLDPALINCVERERPEIDNKRGLLASLNQGKQTKAVIVSTNAVSYDDFAISLKYLINPGANNVNNKCSGDDTCSTPITLTASADSAVCDQSVEQYQICVQREECSKLNIECINNERDLYNALNGNPNPQAGTIAQMESLRKNCNTVLLPFCNSKKGLTTSGDVVSQDYNNPSSGNYYGWFNELCFVKGFETKLRQVYAYDMNGVKGKCLIDPTSPYLTDGNSNTNCDSGGQAPNCICLGFALGSSGEVDAGQVIRRETPREAGLCIDIPLPKICKAIDYNTKSNSNEFVSSSITNSITNPVYNDNTGVDTTHRDRSQDTLFSGHAEFPNAIIGMTNVIGQCKGFWKNDVDSGTGVSKQPLADCVNDGTGTIKWTNFENSCIRYSCSAITTGNPDASGNYPNNYDADDRDETNLEKRGETHGYAMWPAKTKTNDFPESVTATSCITGFKKIGSTTVTNGSGVITSYSGGTSPTRMCNQIGFWLQPNNVCQRISCPAINPPIPANSADLAAWQQWQNSGGATFASVNASRDNTKILSAAISTGVCKTTLGFFQTPGGAAPTRTCDYLGNWGVVQNPCVTECEQITASMAQNDPNSGYATWAKVTITSSQYGQAVNGTFGSCISGYITNPYLGNPQRQCLPQAVQGSPGEYRSVWGVASNSCINKCQGGNKDSVHGKTTYATSSGNITITWPDTDFDQYVYASNRTDLSGLSANHFQQGRSNGEYLVRRKCNADGSWSVPEVMCATNGGSIDNATYGTSGSTTTSAVGVVVNNSTVNGSCSSGFVPDNDNSGDVPVRQCKYKDSNNRIDEVFLDFVSGSQCVRSCAVAAGDKGDHSTLANAINLRAGQQVALNCRSGKCGNNTNARVVCNADGSQGEFDGNCRDCRDCNSGSTIVGTTSCHMDSELTCAGIPRGIVEDACLNTLCNYQVSIDLSQSVAHNAVKYGNIVELSDYLSCSVFTAKACATMKVQCIDGVYHSSAFCDANAVNNRANGNYEGCTNF